VHAQTQDKSDDIKGSFYEELEHVLDKFLKYHMKILCSAKVGRKIFSNQQLGMTVYMQLLIIMVSE
jgi:hypothetical protein